MLFFQLFHCPSRLPSCNGTKTIKADARQAPVGIGFVGVISIWGKLHIYLQHFPITCTTFLPPWIRQQVVASSYAAHCKCLAEDWRTKIHESGTRLSASGTKVLLVRKTTDTTIP